MSGPEPRTQYVELASQFQMMRSQFPAFVEMVQRIDDMIAEEDRTWQMADAMTIDVHRGRKQALLEVKEYLDSFLNYDLNGKPSVT